MKGFPVLVLSAIVLFSCANKKSHEEESGGWKELDAFHKIMAKAYHPLKDSGNLVPAKQLINQLAEEAEKWSGADLPEKVNTSEMKEKLQKLKTEARVLANDVRDGASDDLLKDKMIKLHDQFHEIMEAWSHHEDGEEEEHENN